jgi:hypothetical protein
VVSPAQITYEGAGVQPEIAPRASPTASDCFTESLARALRAKAEGPPLRPTQKSQRRDVRLAGCITEAWRSMLKGWPGRNAPKKLDELQSRQSTSSSRKQLGLRRNHASRAGI